MGTSHGDGEAHLARLDASHCPSDLHLSRQQHFLISLQGGEGTKTSVQVLMTRKITEVSAPWWAYAPAVSLACRSGGGDYRPAGLIGQPLHPRIEDVAQPVAQEVDGEDEEHQHEPWE